MTSECFRGVRGMPNPRGAENGERSEVVGLPTGVEITAPTVSPQDRLGYIAEMVQELKIMSVQANCQVLADLLESAYREAVRQTRAGT